MPDELPDRLPPKSEAILFLRELHELTQKQLAKRAGVSQRCISVAESGSGQVSRENLTKIAISFSVPLKDVAEIQLDESDLPPKVFEASLEVLRYLVKNVLDTPNVTIVRTEFEKFGNHNFQVASYSKLEKQDQDRVWQILKQKRWFKESNNGRHLRLANQDELAYELRQNNDVVLHLERMVGGQIQEMMFGLDDETNVTYGERLKLLSSYLTAMNDCASAKMPLDAFTEHLLKFDLEIANANQSVANCIVFLNSALLAMLRTCRWINFLIPTPTTKHVDVRLIKTLIASREEILRSLHTCERIEPSEFVYFRWEFERAALTHAAVHATLGNIFQPPVNSEFEQYITAENSRCVSTKFIEDLQNQSSGF